MNRERVGTDEKELNSFGDKRGQYVAIVWIQQRRAP